MIREDLKVKEELKWMEKFYTQKDEIKKHMLPGEKFVQCLDKKSFGGKYYYPQYVVTNKGRVWSLAHKKWMIPQMAKEIANAYWSINPKVDGVTKTIYIHCLVNNYFRNDSDEIALEFFDEENVHCHHIFALNIPERLKGEGHGDEKIAHCMKFSCKDNVVYQEKHTDHINDTNLANGRVTSQEKQGTSFWTESLQWIRGLMYRTGQPKGNDYGTFYVYSKDENGQLVKTLVQRASMKGSPRKENEVIVEKYRINSDEGTQFVLDNLDVILERIVKDEPTTRSYTKGIVLEDVSVLYALK